MKRAGIVLIAFASLVAPGKAPGQAPGQSASPTFDVASIKPAAPLGPGRGMTMGMKGGPGEPDPELYRCTNCAIPMLIARAYDIKYYQLTYPDWMDSVRFDISARVSAGATKEQFRLMLQNLLAERFKLTIHRDRKEMQVYEMVVAKGGVKVKESAPAPPKDGASNDPAPLRPGRADLDKNGYPLIPKGCKCMIVENDKARLLAAETTMQEFADRLSNQLSKPVHDATGLKGKYDFDLTWGEGPTPVLVGGGAGVGGSPSAPGGNPPLGTAPRGPADSQQMMIGAVQSEIGLRLESKKGQVEIIVVDHAEKVPTEN